MFGQESGDAHGEPCAGGFFLERAFPDGDDVPTEMAKLVFMESVAGLVCGDLGGPPCSAGFRQAEGWAVCVAVPKATVDEDDAAVFRQDDVGLAGEGSVERAVDGKAVAEAVEQRAESQFRRGVATVDARHDVGAFLRGEDIHHEGSIALEEGCAREKGGVVKRRGRIASGGRGFLRRS